MKEFLCERVAQLREDESVRGVLLNGSWAEGCATPGSDLDLLVLCNEDRFIAEWVDGRLVETHYCTETNAHDKLAQTPMEIYRYLGAKIQFDRGGLAELIGIAEEIYRDYKTPEQERRRLAHWMTSAALKLRVAIETGDTLKANYIAATNAWKLMEATWAVNNRPMPPSSTAFRRQGALEPVPFSGWFEALFSQDLEATLRCFTWAAEQLK